MIFLTVTWPDSRLKNPSDVTAGNRSCREKAEVVSFVESGAERRTETETNRTEPGRQEKKTSKQQPWGEARAATDWLTASFLLLSCQSKLTGSARCVQAPPLQVTLTRQNFTEPKNFSLIFEVKGQRSQGDSVTPPRT